MTIASEIPIEKIRFVKELYPRLREDDATIELYRSAIDRLPPIVVARDGVLVDGFHRWQAHRREGSSTIAAENLGNLSDAEILREAVIRNATHGRQFSSKEKQNIAAQYWTTLGHLPLAERVDEIGRLLSVSRDSIERWTAESRQKEKEAQKTKAWDLWLDCLSQSEIGDKVGADQKTISNWVKEFSAAADFSLPPGSRQHFDVWSFQSGGEGSYFGRMPPQVVENLLWFFTEPGDVVVDPFAGSGTTIDVAKAMGRRVWASDLHPSTPTLPIHEHDMLRGWHADAPSKANLILLDPPYWQQAKGRYSNDLMDLGNVSLDEFYEMWTSIINECVKHLDKNGKLAYIISPTQTEDYAVVDHATDMLVACRDAGLKVERRIIVPYQTQQATGQQVTWARENKRMLKLYRDLVVLSK